MKRVILHCDFNNFYANVEIMHNPKLRNKPVVVGGSEELRHGIVLAKSEIAKRCGVKTGDTIWQAKQKCSGLIVVPPNFKRYLEISEEANEVYSQYTDQIQPFGLDENFLDVTGSTHLFGNGECIANKLRATMKRRFGCTISVGVSFNKVFAKLGSDIKKPDAVTVITKDNFKDKVWGLPVEDLLYVGSATKKKLNSRYIKTIGSLANTSPDSLQRLIGNKWGLELWRYANGLENGFVSFMGHKEPIKSVGNSTTTPHDLITDKDIKITVYLLSESVAARLRNYGYRCSTIQIYVRYNDLQGFERQVTLPFDTCTSDTISRYAFGLIKKHIIAGKPIRSLGVRTCNLIDEELAQTCLLPEYNKDNKKQKIEVAVESLRSRFGNKIVQRATMLSDRDLSDIDPRGENTLQSVAFIK